MRNGEPRVFFKFSAAKQVGDEAAHERHPGLAADENDLVQVFGLEFGIGEGAQAMGARAGDNVAGQGFQFRTRHEFVIEGKTGRKEKALRETPVSVSRETTLILAASGGFAQAG